MRLKYESYKFTIKFLSPVYFRTYPFFSLRSVFGMNLRRTVCILRNYKCKDCPVSNVCSYNILFESYISEDKKVENIFSGSDRIPHPVIISSNYLIENPVEKIVINLTLIGDTIKYFPYVFYSLFKAGENGILKERYKFYIESIKSHNKEILKSGELQLPEKNKNFNLKIESFLKVYDSLNNNKKDKNKSDENNKKIKNHKKIKKRYFIEILSPLRIKKDGKYTDKLEPQLLVLNFFRRLATLVKFYGEEFNENHNKIFYNILKTLNFEIKKSSLKWVDFYYYSSRQKNRIKMGGVLGNMEFEIKDYDFVIRVIDKLFNAMELFNSGKNISFGLGKIKVGEVESVIIK